ncbi:unnamed protein product [Polarella glacialis]|uniref:Uncharacterized protein n=1 Tax=Polarella glacialis TaxID=89957 RepID=A0A813JD06_POLGL|nr:unnamed protein product [Polarella glacialis]CAE8679127.1 unnamed protein product [Polarella glacialis]
MAAVKLIKFVAVAILASSSAAEPTNRTCAGQDQDEMVALQVGEQNHCHCGEVCPGYNSPAGSSKARHFSCSGAKKSYLASNPPGLDQEAFSRSTCAWSNSNTRCWTSHGSAETVVFESGTFPGTCPAGFKNRSPGTSYHSCGIDYATSMNVACPHGWCKCTWLGCGCKARGSCR